MPEFLQFIKQNSPAFIADNLNNIIIITGSLILAVVAHYTARFILNRILTRAFDKTKQRWDNIFVERGVFRPVVYIIPIMVLSYGHSLASFQVAMFDRVLHAAMAMSIIFFFSNLLDAMHEIYQTFKVSKRRPIKGYIQLIKLFIYLIGVIVVVAIFFGKSPWAFISGIGAVTAVLMFIFKDTILAVIASIQIVSYDIVRVGDWIEVPSYGADGDIIDISLHTVKVQNFDKTIVTVPTHKLVENSVKNWRGMQDSGGRRIKRSINIDQNFIRFLTDSEIEKLKEIKLLKTYLEAKEKEVTKDSQDMPVNGRRLTNIGTFRKYIVEYLKNHKDIESERMTFLIRQLAPGPQGLPLELYVFANTTDWVKYEGIQSDIFDHLLSAVKFFDLRVFQEPAGNDFQKLNGTASAEE